MLFNTGLAVLALASAASAQSVVTVQVGAEATTNGGVFQFIPPSVNATKGTIISFQFSGVPGNHSVTQSSFADPCNPLAGGFDSGNLFLTNTESTTPVWNLTVTDDTKPIWFFCNQLLPSPHCTAGMVGAINAPATGNTFANFQKAAAGFQGTPGQGIGALVGVGASASANVGPIPTDATLFGTPAATAASGGSGTTTPAATNTAPPATSNTTTTSGASIVGSSLFSVVVAAVFGITLA